MEIIKLKPYFSERLWGGAKLAQYGFILPQNKKIGEAWVISALENGLSYINDGPLKGQSLKDFFIKHADIFNNALQFPLLTKIISANDYLSVQVHPNDQYGLAHNNMLGKPECWYVLDAPQNAQIIYGHYAKTAKEFHRLVAEKKWQQLFKYVPIAKGDFVYVPPGKVHAITPGVTVYELQRSSDITYRFYDFDRIDNTGKLRPLHIQECLDVTTVPDEDIPITNISDGVLINNDYFTLHLITKNQTLTKLPTKWIQFSVINGKAQVNSYQLVKGESGIIFNIDEPLNIMCQGILLISYQRG